MKILAITFRGSIVGIVEPPTTMTKEELDALHTEFVSDDPDCSEDFNTWLAKNKKWVNVPFTDYELSDAPNDMWTEEMVKELFKRLNFSQTAKSGFLSYLREKELIW